MQPFFFTISLPGQYVFYGSLIFFGGALLKQIGLNDKLSAGKKLAAHYLTDVSIGGLIGTVTGFVFLKLDERAEKKQ